MATFVLCWFAALIVAFGMTVGVIRGGKRQEQVLRVPVKIDADKDADPRRRRRQD